MTALNIDEQAILLISGKEHLLMAPKPATGNRRNRPSSIPIDHSTAWYHWDGEDGIEEAKQWVDNHNQK